ncbi:hypothetical protein CIT292_05969 [Citrobacter youngae ATCC 29220]|uniref:Uncharacterized protein n=1 Tax=Citrobacter youngae ATCC 29220 TaxID=500640 RepID=D4B6N1_9ENTR|nr:hypothetical protein CIT292_05969 [Citrobacter youngae ATCC 29220]
MLRYKKIGILRNDVMLTLQHQHRLAEHNEYAFLEKGSVHLMFIAFLYTFTGTIISEK